MPPINETGGELRGELSDDHVSVTLADTVLSRPLGLTSFVLERRFLQWRERDYAPCGKTFDSSLYAFVTGFNQFSDLAA